MRKINALPRLVDVHIGISSLSNGRKVLTPLGFIGGVYDYNEDLYTRFVSWMRLTLSLGAMAGAVFIGLVMFDRLDGLGFVEGLTLGFFGCDIMRVAGASFIFMGKPVVKISPTDLRYAKFMSTPLNQMLSIISGVVIFSAFLGVVLFSASELANDLLSHRHTALDAVSWLIAAHGGMYLVWLRKAKKDR